MLVKKSYKAVCLGCKELVILYEYDGLEDALYASHTCSKQIALLEANKQDFEIIE